MDNITAAEVIEEHFKKECNNKNIRNAYLLVHSDKLNIHLNIAVGETDGQKAHLDQPNHLASGGKIFTATIIAMLSEKGLLSFDDKINQYLDSELMHKLHFFKGVDYSNSITIKHLLKQTSGLYDVFDELLKIISTEPNLIAHPRDAILWGKKNLKPKAAPGKRHYYTDTNYYLLGLIIESIMQEPFHEVVNQFIFTPLAMKNAYIVGYSQPAISTDVPTAGLYINNINYLKVKGIENIDYAGGGVVAPLEEYLKFFKTLNEGKLIKKETLEVMKNDDVAMGFPIININYGYSIWKFKPVPFFLTKEDTVWGCAGITGAFLLYSDRRDAYIIGNFNDISYTSKAFRFVFYKVIKILRETDQTK